jgi:hypothetical protein
MEKFEQRGKEHRSKLRAASSEQGAAPRKVQTQSASSAQSKAQPVDAAGAEQHAPMFSLRRQDLNQLSGQGTTRAALRVIGQVSWNLRVAVV